jgi:hypothetical protein
MAALARLTNVVQQALCSGKYFGGIWLEGSPFVEETTYWLNLLIDTTVPIVGNSSQRPHGAIGEHRAHDPLPLHLPELFPHPRRRSLDQALRVPADAIGGPLDHRSTE